jgi:hypothetical protein
MKIRGALMVALLAIAPAQALGCRGTTGIPKHDDVGHYQVLAVEVTGVHLTDYEWYRAATLKLMPWPKTRDGEPVLYITSAMPQFKVNVIVRSASSGASQAIRDFSLYGCGIRVPALRESGLIFLGPSGSVGAIWASQEPEYGRWLGELGFQQSPDEP